MNDLLAPSIELFSQLQACFDLAAVKTSFEPPVPKVEKGCKGYKKEKKDPVILLHKSSQLRVAEKRMYQDRREHEREQVPKREDKVAIEPSPPELLTVD